MRASPCNYSARRVLAAFACAALGALGAPAAAAPPTPVAPGVAMSVRFVYLVSADRPVRRDFLDAVTRAAREVQAFYARQLGGPTFQLNTPVVEVAHSDKRAAWFYAHDSGSAKDQWGFDNGLSEARRVLGADYNQPYIWVIYSDGPGSSGRGGGRIAVMPEDDLLGLVGQHPTQKDPRRWVYGMAHELGHALGLAHPDDAARVPNAIMGGGFYHCFPDACELTPEDLAILRASPFIREGVALGDHGNGGSAPPAPAIHSSVYRYDGGGSFTRHAAGAHLDWVETAVDAESYFFDEVRRDRVNYVLLDRSRNLMIKLPKRGGQSFISSDGGKTWGALYVVTPDAR